MSDQVDTITLPLPHCWFEAVTSLPPHRQNETRLGAGLAAFLGVTARTQGVVSDVTARREDNTLDGAQRTFDRYFKVERADDLPVPLYRAALSQTLKASYLDLASGTSLTDHEIEVLAIGLHRLADWRNLRRRLMWPSIGRRPRQPRCLAGNSSIICFSSLYTECCIFCMSWRRRWTSPMRPSSRQSCRTLLS